MMEITVEYHSSDIDAQYVGEVWARQDCAPIKHFIMWTEIELKGKNIPEAFFDALNRDACFHENMHDFIYEAAKHRYDI